MIWKRKKKSGSSFIGRSMAVIDLPDIIKIKMIGHYRVNRKSNKGKVNCSIIVYITTLSFLSSSPFFWWFRGRGLRVKKSNIYGIRNVL